MQNSANFNSRVRRALAAAENLLYRYGAWVVLAIALVYYAQYYRSGLNLSGEGGTTAVTAMRMLEGQKPITEIFLGYNVMWFYPVAWLFQITGPSYIALRIYFFCLCALTAVLAFFVVRKVSGRGWYALLAAMGPLLIPGMIFRNYMGFLALLNMLCLLQAYVFEQGMRTRQLLWMAAAGAAVGITYLVRIELGVFFTVILLGLIALYPLGLRGEFKRRLVRALAGLALLILMFLATHIPIYLDARHRGFGPAFSEQYMGWIGLIRAHAQREMTPPSAPSPVASGKKPSLPTQEEKQYLPRPGEEILQATSADQLLTLAIYLPIPICFFLVITATAFLLSGLWRRDFVLRTRSLILLVTSGSALTLFAQYFFFRPDTPHLSEFMVPFLIALACAGWIAAEEMRNRRSPFARIAAGAFLALCLMDAGIYFAGTFTKESAGTIAARRKRSHEFLADNGVRVLLKKKEQEEFHELYDLVTKYSSKEDYVVCYPYAPTVNFMTNRRSYEYNVYVDNVHHDREFHANTVREMQTYRPAAILIEDRPINKTEASRFSNWAAPTYAYIRENYRHAGTVRRQEIYIRPDLYDQGPQTLPTP